MARRHFKFLWGLSIMTTALYTVVAPSQGRISMACAGHMPPLVVHRDKVSELQCESSLPLLLMDLSEIPSQEFLLEPGDQVLFCTDGITECQDADGNMYETGRLMEAFNASRHLPPRELVHSLVADIGRFTSGSERADDQTLLLMAMR